MKTWVVSGAQGTFPVPRAGSHLGQPYFPAEDVPEKDDLNKTTSLDTENPSSPRTRRVSNCVNDDSDRRREGDRC